MASAKPRPSTGFFSSSAISSRQGLESWSMKVAKRLPALRSLEKRGGKRSESPCSVRTNQGRGASSASRSDCASVSPGCSTRASSKASITTQCRPHAPSTTLVRAAPNGSAPSTTVRGSSVTPTSIACWTRRLIAVERGCSRGPHAPSPSRQRESAAMRA